jgi:hypothetical protein
MQLSDQTIPVSLAQIPAARLRAYQDKGLTGGIRPEAIQLGTSGSQAGSFAATVETVEFLGPLTRPISL